MTFINDIVYNLNYNEMINYMNSYSNKYDYNLFSVKNKIIYYDNLIINDDQLLFLENTWLLRTKYYAKYDIVKLDVSHLNSGLNSYNYNTMKILSDEYLEIYKKYCDIK